MIKFQTKPYTDKEIFAEMNPLVKKWFSSKFGGFSPPQKFSIVNIRHRTNTLISSPTGSGKTLSAFLSILNELIDYSDSGNLEDHIYCLYISPLKALSRDISKNLKEPLQELEALAGKKFGIRVGVRTGDTTASERSAMAKKPPHIMITTPESLAIMLTTTKFRENFKNAEWVIIDEIHSLASGKRGVHLSLSLERLARTYRFCRIGLSATVAPLEDVAKFLAGRELDGSYRDCSIVDVSGFKTLDLQVLSPVRNMIETPFNIIEDKTYELIDKLIQSHRTTLIFTNTRAATERVVHHLKRRFPKNYAVLDDEQKAKRREIDPYDDELPAIGNANFQSNMQSLETDYKNEVRSLIGAHHGSLSKEHREAIENQLREGKLKCVVCSTSLELGIDIGYIDLVILLGSPKSVSRALQRIGRSGHKLHEQSKGRIIVSDRDDLVECSVLLKSAIENKIDHIHIPKNCLDVLAQQVLGYVLEDNISITDLYASVKQSYCYENLDWNDYVSIIKYLSGEYVSLEDRNVYAKIWYDEDSGMIGKKGRMTRVLYMTNVGTIPDETNIKVKLGHYIIGYISEQFLERLHKGDVFVLGGETYVFQNAQGMTARVTASYGKSPTVPSWFSEMLPLSFGLAMEIQKFRRLMNEHFTNNKNKADVLEFIDKYLYLDKFGVEAIYHYFYEQYNYSKIPNDKLITIEHFTEGQDRYAIFHTLYGRRVNDVLSRSVAFAIGRMHHRDVEVGMNDNGFFIRTRYPVQARRALSLVKSHELKQISALAIDKTEILARRFRHCAARALMILRSYMGKTKSVGKQQLSSRLLISAVKRISEDFPVLKEARREVLEDLMDVDNAVEVLRYVEKGTIKVEEVETDVPSPFAFNLILQGYTDILKVEDRMEFLQRMHGMVLAKISLKGKKVDKILPEEFDYDKEWENDDKRRIEKVMDEQDRLMQDLDYAARRVGMDYNLKFELQRMINGDREGFGKDVIDFIEGLMHGTVPKFWTDGLIQFFKKTLPEIK